MAGFFSHLLAAAVLILNGIFYYFPCDHPVAYKLGTVDARFNLSADLAKKDVEEAANVWDQTWGKNVFQEDPTADLTVNFIFDQRQELSNQIKSRKNDVVQNKETLDQKAASFRSQAVILEKKISDLNAQIATWNAKGGAPPDVYQSLTAQQTQLQKEIRDLQAQAGQLNLSINSYNLEVNQFNSTVSDFNSVVTAKPEAGLYDGKAQTISIYYVNSSAELEHTLIHEFGHALGVDHVTNPAAIMYPLTSKTVDFTPDDLAALQKACEKVSKFPAITKTITKFFNNNLK